MSAVKTPSGALGGREPAGTKWLSWEVSGKADGDRNRFNVKAAAGGSDTEMRTEDPRGEREG